MNLLELIERDVALKKTSNNRGGEWHGACPFCGGHDRFRVHPNHQGGLWLCRQCQRGGNDIKYAMLMHNLDFRAAVEFVGKDINMLPRSERVTQGNRVGVLEEQHYPALESAAWQENAFDFCHDCFEVLWCSAGVDARAYLTDARELTPETIERFALGFNPQDTAAKWGELEVFLPRGIVIPWKIAGYIWKINVRRASGDKKYLQVAGGANGLYNADSLRSQETAVIVEGEFDCMVLAQAVRGVTPVATGSTAGSRLTRWLSLLSTAGLIVLAFDNDAGGEGAAVWWKDKLGEKSERLIPPEHDVNDSLMAGVDLQEWLHHASLYPTHGAPDDIDFRAKMRQQMMKNYERVTRI